MSLQKGFVSVERSPHLVSAPVLCHCWKDGTWRGFQVNVVMVFDCCPATTLHVLWSVAVMQVMFEVIDEGMFKRLL